MEAIDTFLTFLVPYGTQSNFVIFAVLIACGFGLPMPEDVVLVCGGILASRDITDLYVVNAVCMAGVLIGDGIVFTIGSKFGARAKQSWLFSTLMGPKVDQKIQRLFDRYHDKVIFVGRFTPGLRTPIFLTAGIYGVPAWKFFAIDGFAALISVPLWIWIGYVFGSNMHELERRIGQFQYGLVGVILGMVVLAILVSFVKRLVLR